MFAKKYELWHNLIIEKRRWKRVNPASAGSDLGIGESRGRAVDWKSFRSCKLNVSRDQ